MRTEAHLRNIKESLEEIEEAVHIGLSNRQRSLGFHASAACADMIELLLHEKKLVSPGFILKHEWLKSEKLIKLKLNFDFPNKDELLSLARNIELERNKLCYGTPQHENVLEKVLKDFNRVKMLIKEDLNEIE